MSDSSTRPQRLKPRGGLAVQYAAIRALFLRELQTRFGHYRIGYLWAILDPALDIVFMLILFGAIIHRTLVGIDYTVFLINGVIPFYVFRKSAISAMSAIQANKGLLSYRNVKPIDTVVARTFLEWVLYGICYILFSMLLLWLGYYIGFSHIPELLLLWLVLLVFSLGFASVMMVVGSYSSELNKLISPIFFILYFISGALIPIQNRIPQEYLVYVIWNPLLHIFDLMRVSVVPTYTPVPGVSLIYVLECTVGVFFLGLLLYRVFAKTMVTSK